MYEVSVEVARMSKLVDETIGEDIDEDEADDMEVPLPNVSTMVLEKVLEFCKHHHEEPMTPIQTPLKSSKLEELVQPWYAEFVKVPRPLLFDMVAAANFMDIKALLDLTCLAVSILIKGKSAAELREMFNIAGDYNEDTNAGAPPVQESA
jgi:S-phase kinase-associated protein 1